jgi:hypothetical protein
MWKYSQIIMILKSGKTAKEVKSYRPISLLPVTSKLFEKLILKRIRNDLCLSTAIPDHKFGFREGHTRRKQTHRVVNKIINLEEKTLCKAVFLEAAQALDKVWHTGLLYKKNIYSPVHTTYY